MFRARLVAILVFAIAMAALADPAGSDSASPQSVFDNRGLTQSDVWLVLPYESAVHDGAGKVKEKAQAVHVETTARRDLRRDIQTHRHNLLSLLAELVDNDAQVNRLVAEHRQMSTADQSYSQVLDMLNAALNRHNTLSKQTDDEQKALYDAQAQLEKVPDSRGQFDILVMDAASQAESIAKSYAALSQDAQLAQAIASTSANGAPPLKLGPSPVFAADLEFLRKAVKEIIDSPIPVRVDPNNSELVVQAEINGTASEEMLWDSGADIVLLNADTARELGIRPTDQDATAEMEMPGGNTEKVHVVTLDSIRLGGFTVRNVACLVMPEGSDHSDNLLGDTFQTHFISRMDQRSQELQLTPADSSVLVGAIPHELTPTK